jgi:transcriptional regulator with XRE-family HTH domain
MLLMMGFRENLKTELSYQDIKVKELAAKTGISKHTLDNYLNVREYMPSADAAVKIAGALGVSVEYLVTGKDARVRKLSIEPEIRILVQKFKQLDADDRKMIMAIMQLYKNRWKNLSEDKADSVDLYVPST